MNEETLFRVIVAGLFLACVTIGVYYRRRAARSGEKISRREEGWRIMVPLRLLGFSVWGVLVAYLLNPQWVAWSTVQLPSWLRWTGVVLAFAAIPLIYWVFSSLGKNVTDTVVTRKEHALVTSGPYRWVRHPLYTVASIFFLGVSLAAANWAIALLIMLTLVMLAVRTPLEEARLIERFGDEYRTYMQRTGRFLPKTLL